MSACGGLSDDEAARRLTSLSRTIGSDALNETDAARLSEARAELEALTKELGSRRMRHDTARRDWLLGECHRLRHLFDEPGAWEESERLLTLAVTRDPKFTPAHVSLGQLYLTGGFDWAPRAERAFVHALEESGGTPLPAAQKGLFFAYYYQGRWADAVRQADRYLALEGADVDVAKMREMAHTNMKQGEKKPT